MRILASASLFFLCIALLCTGCDSVRASLGKPTSADLAVLRAERAAREQAARDSAAAAAEAAAQAVADSIAAAASAGSPAQAAPAGEIKRYYVVAGAFKEPSGVRLFGDRLTAKGLTWCTLSFKNGTTVLCAEGTDDLAEARRQMAAFKAAGFDCWIYNSKQNLHK